MTARLVALCVHADDPSRLAGFWANTLRWTIGEASDSAVRLVSPEDSFGIVFRLAPHRKVGRPRIHLDLTTASLDDQRDSVDRVLARGGRHLDIGQGPDEAHVVLADPEGNELCLIEPGNQFLAGCGRLGALSCDGTRAVGCFWSEVLGWPLVWDQDEETAIRAPDGTGALITWGGPPLHPKQGLNHLLLEIAPADGGDQASEVDRLVGLGAIRLDLDSATPGAVVLADPDGNELVVLPT